MVNKDIARQFNLLASLMELHGENAFKTKAYSSAYLSIRKWDTPIEEMAAEDIDKIPGIGSSVISKIRELLSTGRIDALEKLPKYENEIDLVILDIVMPRMNGKEVYKRLKEIRDNVRVLLTSGYTPDTISKQGFLDEKVDILEKPHTPGELLKKVAEITST